MSVKDWRGRAIKNGSVVVYPSRQGSSLWMSEAVVVSTEPRIGVIKTKGAKRISYPHVGRITVVG